MRSRPMPLIVLVGPTASGKSALAVDFARRFNGEIISADSRQVYRGLDIGSGKITKREMRGIPHYLLSVASPKRTFTAHDFAQKARAIIEDIVKRGKIPIICGGTGFYIDTLLGRIELPDTPVNPKLRARLAHKTPAQLFTLLQKRDAARALQMDTPSERNNTVRLIRALEVASARNSKKSYPQFTRRRRLLVNSRSEVLRKLGISHTRWIGIAPSMPVLEKNIHARLVSRMKAGMLAEARRLHRGGLSWRRMESLGLEYRFLALLLKKEITRAEFDERLFREIRRYAKRQMTYWKRNTAIHWFLPEDRTHLFQYVTNIRAQ